MKQVKSRYNYDPSQPLSKQYQDAQVFNAYYKCFDTQTNAHYLLSHFKTQNKTQINSLLKKFTTIQSKMHQGINTKYLSQIHDIFLIDKDKSLILISDYCEGGSIIDYIAKVYTLQPKTAVRIILGTLNGLQQLHKYDIFNCFINLENIQIDQAGIPKLSFKCMIYKTIYLSPEFRKEHVKSRQSDLYCLGVCLYRLIFGIFPFKTQKTQELIEMVKKGPSFAVQKDDGLFPIRCPSPIRQILKGLLNFNPEVRSSAVQKFEPHSKHLLQTSLLSQQVYLKFFKSKYIPIYINTDEMDQHEYSILDTKEKKLLKLVVYNASKAQIDAYLNNVISGYAKLSGDSFVKIYEYQIIQEEYLALVYSYCGEGSLAQYRRKVQYNFPFETIQNTVGFLNKSLRSLQSPYKYLTNQSIYLKNGNLRIRFPEFHSRRFQQMVKKQGSSGSSFIAPQILTGQQSQRCDSWSIGVIQYWMIYNQMPQLDSKGTLVPNQNLKLSKEKLLYFHNVIQRNPNNRLNVLYDEQFIPQLQIKLTTSKVNDFGEGNTTKKSEKVKRSKRKDLPPLQQFKGPNPNLLPNQVLYDHKTASKSKNPIIIDTKESLPQKNPNKFDMKMFNDPEQIKTPQKVQTVDKTATASQSADISILAKLCQYTVKMRSRFASLQRSYTKSIRISIKCLLVLLIYLFLFYFNFFRISGSLIGSRQMYEPKIVQIRAFSSDSRPAINYTLVTKTPIQTYHMFYNTTVPVLRDEYKCVLNDYSVKSNVALIIKSQGFVAFQVIGLLIALFNIIMVCIVIARYDLCKVCHVTNFDEKKYHTLINYGIIMMCIFSLTSLHYLIYGGLYHIMLEPCLGKSALPGLQFLMKNWFTSWIFRFLWAYLGIVISYAIIIFFLIKPLIKLNKYFYMGFVALYLMGVGIRGIGKSHPGHENTFGVCGQLLGLLVSIFLFFTDLMFTCFARARSQQSHQNNIDTRSIQDFNKTQEYFFGNGGIDDDHNEK